MRILEVCVDLDGGGIDRYLYNYCSRIQGIQFDFATVDSKKDGILEPDLRKRGCKIFRVPRMSSGLRKNYKALHLIMTENHYDAVHVHLGYKGFLALLCAKNCGIHTRIVHAHIANVPETKLQRYIRFVLTQITKHLATNLAACGIDAAKWVWGSKAYHQGSVIVHNNAIETHKYQYNSDIDIEYRKKMGIEEDVLVIGHIGRLSDQKNQLRLLDIFSVIHKQQPRSCLMLVGRGEQENEVREKIRSLGLEKSVMLLGVRSDVPSLLNMMDVFVFPSKYEGLPFTLIETQCNGLKTISSDTVTAQVKVSDCIEFLSLEDSNELWASAAVIAALNGHNIDARQSVITAGYDIDTEAEHLKNYYINLIRNEAKNGTGGKEKVS